MNLIGSYNYALVALSVFIALLASFAALDLAGRVTASSGWTRASWLLGGASAMGTGIWSMHYIGMLAFILTVPVAYHWPTVLLSLLAAILASAIALYIVSRQEMGVFRAFAGSILMGAGIAGMHYIGMDAMRLPAMCHFDPFLVALSVVFAFLISLAALWIAFHFRVEKARIDWRKIGGASVMGAAIPVMHYTGMAAASFTASDNPVDLSAAVSISALGTAGITGATVVVLGLALLTSWVDRRFTAHALVLQEEKLQQSEAYLSEAQRLSNTGSFGWKVESGQILWSDETFRIFQYDRALKPTLDLVLHRVHPDDAIFVQKTIGRASQDGTDFDLELRLVMPDGSVKHVHVVAHAICAESGSIEFVGAIMDVTAQRHARSALENALDGIKKSQEALRLVVNTIPSMVWSALPDGSVDFVSQSWVEYYGMSLEDLGHRGMASVVHPDDVADAADKWQSALVNGKPFELELRSRRADGEYRWFITRAVPLRDERANVIKWYGTITDIEDRKQADEIRNAQALQASLRADVSTALSRPATSREILGECTDAIVRHLDAAFARIWTLNKESNVLELQASSGMYTHLDGAHGRIEVGKLKIGLIAQEKTPYLTNEVPTDPWVSDKIWAQNERMVSFAGYPLLVQDRVVGVMAMFAHHRLSAITLDTLASVAESIAQGIERKQTEERIRQSEAYLAEAQRLSHTGSFGLNVSNWEVFWSEETFRIFECERSVKPTLELMLQRIHPEDVARVRQAIDRASSDGTDWDLEHRLLMPDGSVKYVHFVTHPGRDESDRLEFVGAVLDITERKHAEVELRESERNLRLLVDAIPGMVGVTSVEGENEYSSQRVLEYTGKTMKDMAGFGWTSVFHPDDIDGVMRKWLQAIGTGDPYETEFRMRRFDGIYRWFHVRAEPLRVTLKVAFSGGMH